MKKIIDETQKLRQNQFKLILIILAMMSVLFIAFTIYWEIDYNNKYGYFKKVRAEVVDHVVVDNIEYDVLQYSVRDVVYKHTTEYESKNHIEDKLNVFYDENDPSGIVYKLDNTRILLPVISVLFVLVSSSVYIIYFYIFRKTHDTMQTDKKDENNEKK
ncbi:MAG: hypothetical protein E7345_00935 [Clostridiales bacterium]|nr:hypothetical protein [Clostridiales bacterium]